MRRMLWSLLISVLLHLQFLIGFSMETREAPQKPKVAVRLRYAALRLSAGQAVKAEGFIPKIQSQHQTQAQPKILEPANNMKTESDQMVLEEKQAQPVSQEVPIEEKPFAENGPSNPWFEETETAGDSQADSKQEVPDTKTQESAGSPAAPSGAVPEENLLPVLDKRDYSDGEDLQGAYLALLRERVEAARIYPRQALRRGLAGKVLIRLVVGVTGEIESVILEESSLVSSLDHAAMETVRSLHSLPPLPQSFGERLEVVIPLVYRLDRFAGR